MALVESPHGTSKFGLSLLKHRDFALLFSGTIVSHTGDLLQSMAQAWLVFQLTGSGFKLGLLGFCQLAPRLLLGAFGGVLVDRFDRRRLLIGTQIIAMLQSIIFFALVVTGRITFSQIVALSLVLGVVDTLHLTARHALIPHLVPNADLQAGIALNAAGMNLTHVIGPSIGGALLSVFGVSGCLAINAVSFTAILGALLSMRIRLPPAPKSTRAMSEDLAEGLRYVRQREALWVPIAMAYGLAALAMAYSRLLPLFASNVLHAGVGSYGALLAAPGLGAVIAALVVASRGRGSDPERRLYISVLTVVAGLFVFACSSRLDLSLVALTVVGAAQMTFRASAMGACQMATDDLHRGRVMSIFLLDYGFWSFGTLWLGFLADAHGPRFAVLAGASSCLLVTLVVAAAARRARFETAKI